MSYTTFNLRKASRNIPGVGGQTRGSRAFIRNVLLDCSIWARTRRVSVLFSLLFAAVLGMMDAQAPFDLENGQQGISTEMPYPRRNVVPQDFRRPGRDNRPVATVRH